MQQFIKIIILGFFVFFTKTQVSAQCGTIHVNASQILYPDTISNLPVATRGETYSTVIQIFVPTLYQGASINSVQLTSVSGLPSGFNYTTYPTNGILNAGTSGCIIITSSNVIASIGTYPLTLNVIYNVQFLGNVASTIKGYKINVQNSIPLGMTTKVYHESCPGKMDGSIKIKAVGGKTHYLFALGNNTYSSNDSFTNLGAGIYTTYVKDSMGTIISKTDTIKSNPKPTIGSILGPINVSPLLTAPYGVNQQSGLTFAWSVTNGILLNGQGTNAVQITWGNQTGTGSLFVKATNNFGCDDTTSLTVNIKSSGLNEITSAIKPIYPNPTSDLIHLELTDKNAKITSIKLFDCSGKLVAIFSPKDNPATIDMTTYQQGYYWLSLELNAQEVENIKVFKQ